MWQIASVVFKTSENIISDSSQLSACKRLILKKAGHKKKYTPSKNHRIWGELDSTFKLVEIKSVHTTYKVCLHREVIIITASCMFLM